MGFLFWSLAAFTLFVFAPMFYVLTVYGPEVLRMMREQSERRTLELFKRKGWCQSEVRRREKEMNGEDEE